MPAPKLGAGSQSRLLNYERAPRAGSQIRSRLPEPAPRLGAGSQSRLPD